MLLNLGLNFEGKVEGKDERKKALIALTKKLDISRLVPTMKMRYGWWSHGLDVKSGSY
jgi:hypothetical protein